MPAVVLQRYLLSAGAVITPVPASATLNIAATTPLVPLGSKWTIRIRRISSSLNFQDASGSLQVEAVANLWRLIDANGNVLYTVATENSIIVPSFVAPKLTIAAFWSSDADQTISSLDQVGANVPVGVLALSSWTLLNSDAANPHSASVICNAILEFEAPGSGE